MENNKLQYTVEYHDGYGVIYFETVTASCLSDAKMQILQRFPDVSITAVTVVTDDQEDT